MKSCPLASTRALHIVVLLALGACSKDDSTANPNQTTAGTQAAAGGGAGVGAAGTSAGSTAVGVAGTGVGTGTGGRSAAGTGASAAGGGASGSRGTATAGTGAAGTSATAGTGAGGTTSAGTGGGAAAGTGGAATGCTRELLKATTDAYYTALAAHDPSSLPLADNVKFTEDGMMMAVGEGLWKTAGMLKYKHSAYDTETCTSVSESVVPDGSTDIPYGLRIKLQDQKITEIETLAIHQGDYKVGSRPFPSNPNAIVSSNSIVKWEEVVPADKRNTREEISGWLERYFTTFPAGGCNFADNCNRLENGGGSFTCDAALSCSMSASGGGGGGLRLDPRLIIVDVETGIGVGFTMFAANTDFHMIKMYGGEIYAVHAILGAAMGSGWD